MSLHPSGSFPLLAPSSFFRLLFGSLFVFLCLIKTGHAEPRGDAKLGKALYAKYCVSCHGLKGDGLGARSTLPNFTDAKLMSARTDTDLFNKITLGGKGSGMPAWNKTLSEPERWHIVAYIRTLSNSTP